jgi:Flp pilus assembly protein TadG
MAKRMKLANRRGVTLVLMTLMLTIMIGMSAFVLDFGQFYLYRSQMQEAADAAAIAGVMHLQRGFGTAAKDTAIAYDTLHNKFGTNNHTIISPDVRVGKWTLTDGLSPCPVAASPGTCVFTEQGDWTEHTNNAVQVVSTDTARFGFGHMFGFGTKTLSVTAVAAWGSSNSSTCTRPWAVPYQAMLDVLYPPAGTKPTSYTLTDDDITRLAQMTSVSNPVELKVGTAGDLTPNGEFYVARLPAKEYANGTAGNPWTGGNDYSNAIGDTCAQLATQIAAQGGTGTISIGDWLEPETGNKVGPTKSGVEALCGGDTCTTPLRMVVALWDTEGPSPGGNCTTSNPCYHIKYLGVFSVTGWDQTNKAVNGYFNTMTSLTAAGFVAGGATTGSASAVIIFALVK